MHEVPRLRTKVVRGFGGRVAVWTKARITKTARTPTDKSVWGIMGLFIGVNIVEAEAEILFRGRQKVVS